MALRIEREPKDGSEAFLDLTVRRGTERRQLRFWSPQELEIERGGPTRTGGFQIQASLRDTWKALVYGFATAKVLGVRQFRG